MKNKPDDDAATVKDLMLEAQSANPQLKLPPPVFEDMQGEFVTSDARSLIVAAMDNTLGPLAYALAPPSATLTLTTNFIRAVSAADKHIVVTARLEDQTKRFLYLSAEASTENGEVLARCTSTMMIVGRRRPS